MNVRTVLGIFFWANSMNHCYSHAGHHEESMESHEHDRRSSSDHPVLIISFDGFRYDYLDKLDRLTGAKNVQNYFKSVISSGVWAKKGLTNVFSTVTFPNHYSMATGLYQETHGVVGNNVYLPAKHTAYSLPNLNNTSPEAIEIYGGEPIWVTFASQKSPLHVGCFMWVGCSVPVKNLSLPFAMPYRESSCEERIDFAVNRWLSGGMQLVLLYFNEPDHTGHRFGPDSAEVEAKLLELNDCLGKLMEAMHQRELHNVNMLLVSDHGMVKFKQHVVIPQKPDLYDIWVSHYSHFLLQPLPGKESESMAFLRSLGRGIKVYNKSHIPDHWHYKNNERISEILVVGEVGVALATDNKTWPNMVAGHGYDNSAQEMRPIFLAKGFNH